MGRVLDEMFEPGRAGCAPVGAGARSGGNGLRTAEREIGPNLPSALAGRFTIPGVLPPFFGRAGMTR